MRWSYKTVHYDLKKEGILGSSFLDESEIELSLNQYGKAGWELISLLETLDGLIAVFKQPLDMNTRSFSTSIGSSERMSRAPKRPEIKSNIFKPKVREKDDFEILEENEDVAEAMLLDEFEVVEDKVEENCNDDLPRPPVDVGMIKIE
jgi:hypothetical protein